MVNRPIRLYEMFTIWKILEVQTSPDLSRMAGVDAKILDLVYRCKSWTYFLFMRAESCFDVCCSQLLACWEFQQLIVQKHTSTRHWRFFTDFTSTASGLWLTVICFSTHGDDAFCYPEARSWSIGTNVVFLVNRTLNVNSCQFCMVPKLKTLIWSYHHKPYKGIDQEIGCSKLSQTKLVPLLFLSPSVVFRFSEGCCLPLPTLDMTNTRWVPVLPCGQMWYFISDNPIIFTPKVMIFDWRALKWICMNLL